MTKMVVKRVEEIAHKQGVKSCKFFDRKGRPMLQRPIDTLLEGVGDDVMLDDYEVIKNDGEFPDQDLPEQEVSEEVESESDDSSLEPIDKDELEDLVKENRNFLANQESETEESQNEPPPDIEDGQEDGSVDENICPEPPGIEEEPDLVSEDAEIPPRRSGRIREAPPRYNPESGGSYVQAVLGKKLKDKSKNAEQKTEDVKLTPLCGKNSLKSKGLRPGTRAVQWGKTEVASNEKVHVQKETKPMRGVDPEYIEAICNHIRKKEKEHNFIQVEGEAKEKTLDYAAYEAGVVGGFLIKHCFSQMYIMQKGVKVFGARGVSAAKEELKQLHDRTCWRALAVKELTRQERERAMECLMFLTEKKTNDIKGRLAYNGKPTRDWITREDKSSPMAHTESILLTAGIDALQRRDVMSLGIPNAFIQAKVPKKPRGEQIVMKIRGVLVDWLVEMDPHQYAPFVVYEDGKKVLYVEILQALYGMLIASLTWYRKLRADLEGIGFVFNPYDGCVANRLVKGKQQTIRFHVDDILASHMDAEVNSEFYCWCMKQYGKLKPVKVKRGKVHDFLGMRLDFGRTPGAVHIIQEEHVKDMLESFQGELSGKALTPAANDLFLIGAGRLLGEKRKEMFHTVVAKGIFIGKQSRPDIMPTVSVLSSRVRCPSHDDYKKLRRLLNYIKRTLEEHLVIKIDEGFNMARWFVDASYAVHPDFKSHTGGCLFLGEKGGAMVNLSQKQKLNTRSSTEAELVGVDDAVGKIMWVEEFLKAQGFGLGVATLYQDNKSAILLETKGKESSSKRTRHINIRYFHIMDLVEKNRLKIEYRSSQEMAADFFTKPLQGAAFSKFKALILGQGLL